jgi:hypothetical protein
MRASAAAMLIVLPLVATASPPVNFVIIFADDLGTYDVIIFAIDYYVPLFQFAA